MWTPLASTYADHFMIGRDQPFKTDTEGRGVMAGNACYNLVGDPEAIRLAIETNAVCAISDAAKAKIIVSRAERTQCDDSETELLYPNIDTRHAVINRMKEQCVAT